MGLLVSLDFQIFEKVIENECFYRSGELICCSCSNSLHTVYSILNLEDAIRSATQILHSTNT
jgi:hypothetical protein